MQRSKTNCCNASLCLYAFRCEVAPERALIDWAATWEPSPIHFNTPFRSSASAVLGMGGLLSGLDGGQGQGASVPPAAAPVDCKQFLREASGRLSEFYVRVRDLGEGAYGEVFLARQRIGGRAVEREGRLCAVKRVRKPNVEAGLDEEGATSQEALEEFRVEVELMKSLDHPSICRLLQVYEDPKNLRPSCKVC
eukprot:Skav221276  [mRNA]  locus=scaffold2775:61168:61749:+ [translate_table: standard]